MKCDSLLLKLNAAEPDSRNDILNGIQALFPGKVKPDGFFQPLLKALFIIGESLNAQRWHYAPDTILLKIEKVGKFQAKGRIADLIPGLIELNFQAALVEIAVVVHLQ